MIAAPRPMVFQRLIDPETVSAAAPGVESVETVGDHHFRISSGFGVGAIKLQFILDVELSDIVAPERRATVRMGADGALSVDVQPHDIGTQPWSGPVPIKRVASHSIPR